MPGEVLLKLTQVNRGFVISEEFVVLVPIFPDYVDQRLPVRFGEA
jgi:hypothetical protein